MNECRLPCNEFVFAGDWRPSDPFGTTQASRDTAVAVNEDEAVEPSSEPVVIESLDSPQLHNSSATVDKDSMVNSKQKCHISDIFSSLC